MNTVIMDGSAANPGDISWAPLEGFGTLTVYDTTSEDQIIDRCKDADMVITNKTPFKRKTLESLPKLRYIGVLATGFNVIDLDCCRERGIAVTNVPEYSTYATAQMAIALLLEMTNSVALHSSSVHDGDWVRSDQFCYWKMPLTELLGKKVAVVGYGKIGQRVSAILSSMGASVIAVPRVMPEDPASFAPVRFMTLEEAAPVADIITFHCPLTPDTEGIINRSLLQKCKKGVLIVNAARGGLCNEADMRSALEEGLVGGYAADVVSVEPMKADNPLLHAPNCILTPHIAWAAKETRVRLIDIAADNIRSFLAGGDLNRIC
ncbi:MAG: D-2-hydroxyacid dehydrogenase [Clostridiales bacterium]|nr:D-2-hydroxyacid dehydrogenase [Clostridiales bacterium]